MTALARLLPRLSFAALWHNRDFTLLWSGQALSTLGSRISGVAYPLLILALTRSPAAAGLAEGAALAAILAMQLPAGILVDRFRRKRVMLGCDVVRALAVSTIVGALLLGRAGFAQILAISVIDGAAWAVYNLAERTALFNVVSEEQQTSAVSANQARTYAAQLAGPPLGGLLFGIGRALPFAADAISYLASLVTLLLISKDLEEPKEESEESILQRAREGLAWFWRHPALRDIALLVAGSDFVINALYLVLVVDAQRHGASSAEVGAMFGIGGAGGLAGSLLAPRLALRVGSPRLAGLAVWWLTAALVPLLLAATNAYELGLIYGSILASWPLWNAVMLPRRIGAVPDRLRGRVQGTMALVAMAPMPVASLAAGILLQYWGVEAAVLVFTAVAVAVALAAVWTPGVRAVSLTAPGSQVKMP